MTAGRCSLDDYPGMATTADSLLRCVPRHTVLRCCRLIYIDLFCSVYSSNCSLLSMLVFRTWRFAAIRVSGNPGIPKNTPKH
eukprot:3708735-Amphidinium_carterae.1